MKQYVQSQHFTSTADIMAAMKEMFRDVIQQVMEVEMDEELGRERCQRTAEENASPNYRNGYSQKTVKTQLGEIDIKVPRDRKGNFEPKIISKYDRNAEGSWNCLIIRTPRRSTKATVSGWYRIRETASSMCAKP